jgi:hypothetical protein
MLIGVRRSAVFVLIGGALAGCANSGELKARINGRWGPDPGMQAADFVAVSQNQAVVLNYIERSLGYIGEDGRRIGPSDWKEVAQWGFNVGRQDCEIYMDNLFQMSREKGRNDSIFAALGTAAAAIVTGTTTSQKPLSILAAVFGLSIALNDSIFQSYLFTQAPGLVAKKVGDLQDEFRNSVVSNQITIDGPTSAYYAIQTYYRICLPHSIEGVMLQTIADSRPANPTGGTAGGGGAGGGAGFAVVAPAARSRSSGPGTMRTPELRLGR